MRLPALRGVIDRQIVLGYRIDADVAQTVLPYPFRPRTHQGCAFVSLTLYRVKELRPRGVPALFGLRSENASIRFPIRWEQDGQWREGVFMERHVTSSRFDPLGNRGLRSPARNRCRFTCREQHPYYALEARGSGGLTLWLNATAAEKLPRSSIFSRPAEAADFLNPAPLFSESGRAGVFDCTEISTAGWRVAPLDVCDLQSSFVSQFPPGSVEFDCGLLMRRAEHQWRAGEPLRAVSAAEAMEYAA